MNENQDQREAVLFPPLPEEFERMLANVPEGIESERADLYEVILESQCGATDDSQPVELYNGNLGVSTGFVNAHQRPVGQLQWNSNLGNKYNNPGNVSGVRWCTGTLISANLFLTAGHCFDSTGGGWIRPRVNGTNNPISPSEIARNMHVNFNYQVDSNGTPRPEQEFAIVDLIEYRLGGLDFAIVRLEGAPGHIFGIGEVSTVDANVNDMLCIIGHPAGQRKRIEAGPLTSFQGFRVRYNDIDTLGGNSGSAIWRASTGKIIGVHTNGGCTTVGTGSNFGVRISRILEESLTLQSLIAPPLKGNYTIQQVSNNRFLDAHESSSKDYNVVTRTVQNNNTQRWNLMPIGAVYKVQQLSNSRFLDAHESSGNNYRAVTRTNQNNDTQKWVFLADHDDLSTYTIQQLSSGRYLDAYTSGSNFTAVTRTAQNNDTQKWILSYFDDDTYTIRQKYNTRFLDAYQSTNDNDVVIRTAQNNDTQRWVLTKIGMIYTVQQLSSGRFLDAHENSSKDYDVVTRTAQQNDTQKWIITPDGDDQTYRIQQLSNARFIDAHEHSGEDYSVVTRTKQNNNTQRWLIKKV